MGWTWLFALLRPALHMQMKENGSRADVSSRKPWSCSLSYLAQKWKVWDWAVIVWSPSKAGEQTFLNGQMESIRLGRWLFLRDPARQPHLPLPTHPPLVLHGLGTWVGREIWDQECRSPPENFVRLEAMLEWGGGGMGDPSPELDRMFMHHLQQLLPFSLAKNTPPPSRVCLDSKGTSVQPTCSPGDLHCSPPMCIWRTDSGNLILE